MQLRRRYKRRVKENKMEGCKRDLMGKETDCAVCLFLLIRIRFHKDPHDCPITRGIQGGMRKREEVEASRDTMKLINGCLPSPQLLSLFF